MSHGQKYGAAPLESVLITGQLRARPPRLPDYQAQSQAAFEIACHMMSPQAALQKLSEIALKVCRAGSAGISLLSEKNGDFYLSAVSGALQAQAGSRAPRDLSPSGLAIDRNAAQLFTRPQRYYTYLASILPATEEELVVPFYVAGKGVGTIWIIAHDTARKFDCEDARLLNNLGQLAAIVYALRLAPNAQEQEFQSLRDVNERLLLSSIRQQELTEEAQRSEAVVRESEGRLTRELAATQRLQETSTQLIGEDNDEVLYQRILAAAASITGSDFASIQILDSERGPSGELHLASYRGFSPEAARFWEWVRPDSNSTCGIAMCSGERVTVHDVEKYEAMAGTSELEMYLRAGIHAAQSTPLLSREGRFLGMLSTHWRTPHQPSDSDLHLVDVLARQAADFIERSQVQGALHRTEADLRNFLETAAIGLHWANDEGIILWANEADYELLGYTREEYVGHHIAEFYEDESVIEEIFSRLARGETLTDYAARLRSKNGSIRDVLIDCSVLFEDGNFVHTRCFTRDVTERKRAEEALRESGRHFRALAEAIPVIVWTADASGAIDWYNNRWYEYTGQTPEEAAGWGWQAAHHPDDFQGVMEAWICAIATGEPLEMEFRLRRYDGVFHHFLTRIRPFRNERGDLIRWYGSNVDIQEQKVALEHSQRIAETLQGRFLPRALPHTDKVRFDAVYIASEKGVLVGGDWFEAVQLPNGRYLVSVGDVTGHGLDASLIADRLRQAITDFGFINNDPAAILANANRILRFQHPDVYATAVVALIEPDCTRLTYASAGHPPPLLATSRNAPAQVLPHGGLPLGVSEDLQSVARSFDISPDAVVAFYTDGITEFARNIDAAEKALRAAIAQIVGDSSIESPAIAIQRKVLGGARPVDDIAILIAQFGQFDEAPLNAGPAVYTKTWRFHSSDAYTAHSSRQDLVAFIRGFVEDPNAVFTAEIILGEILANSVEHAPGLVEINIDWTGEKPIVTVTDNGPGLRNCFSDLPRDVMAENGRGLFLINALAEEVSVSSRAGDQTQLRAVLPLTRYASS